MWEWRKGEVRMEGREECGDGEEGGVWGWRGGRSVGMEGGCGMEGEGVGMEGGRGEGVGMEGGYGMEGMEGVVMEGVGMEGREGCGMEGREGCGMVGREGCGMEGREGVGMEGGGCGDGGMEGCGNGGEGRCGMWGWGREGCGDGGGRGVGWGREGCGDGGREEVGWRERGVGWRVWGQRGGRGVGMEGRDGEVMEGGVRWRRGNVERKIGNSSGRIVIRATIAQRHHVHLLCRNVLLVGVWEGDIQTSGGFMLRTFVMRPWRNVYWWV